MRGKLRYSVVAPALFLSLALAGALFFAPTLVSAAVSERPAAAATVGPYGGGGGMYGMGGMGYAPPSRYGPPVPSFGGAYGSAYGGYAGSNYYGAMAQRPSCVRAVHVVRFGEDLFRIGLAYRMGWPAIAAANHLRNPNVIFAGERLWIPCSGARASAYPSTGGSYNPSPAYPSMGGSSNPYATPAPQPSPSASSTPGSGNVTVTMRNIAFNPANITIRAGQTVVWTNQDSAPHTTTSGSCSGNTCTPVAGWDSGTLNTGQSFSHTFDTPGTFHYYCMIHGAMMQGTVTVTQ